MYSVRVTDHCPEHGGVTHLVGYPTIEEAMAAAARETAEASTYGINVSVTVIINPKEA